MPDFTIASQDEILTAAGVRATGPSAATVAQRIATDHVVLEKASQLAAQHFITQAVESLSPQERERLIKRTADQNAPKPATTTEDVRFAVDVGEYSGSIFVVAIGPEKNLGNGRSGPSGKMFYNGAPDKLKHWHPFGSRVLVPQYVIDEYAARYQGAFANATPQSSLYAKLMCPDGPMDCTKIPGSNYDATRGPDPARIQK